MIETSQLKKYLMWYKVKELFSEGLNNTQIGQILGLHRQTVAKYLSMTESEFLSSESYDRHYCRKLDSYEPYILNELRKCPFLSAPQIHDRLKENFSSLPSVTPKTVFNFVHHIREANDLPKETEKSYRPYEKQPETPYGEYAQCDFGERWIMTPHGPSLKVYFFAISMSRSRYKFVYFSRIPFTTAHAVYAHELAFEFFGGIPRKIIYDQDKLFLVRENLGDLILTGGFRTLVREHGFDPIFCRKSDPQSKGKIENVVKYVKYNFLRGREFTDIDTLNNDALGWLRRTANGTEHHGIRRVPCEEFEMEKIHLMPYKGVPTKPSEKLVPHHVRKDNVINYRGNYYSVPTGTYCGHKALVYIEEKEGSLHIYSLETGKTLAIHKISCDKGKFISNTSHRRNREASLDDYEVSVRNQLPQSDIIDIYLSQLRINKARNYRDNLQFIASRHSAYSDITLTEAFSKCLETSVFNGSNLMDVAESIRIRNKEKLIEVTIKTESVPKVDTSSMFPERTDISTFNTLFT
jgi:Integrase core domain